jgi:hypothetical protein
MRDIHVILNERRLLDWVERLDEVRSLHEMADHNVHIAILVDNALREAADFLVQLREKQLVATAVRSASGITEDEP